MGNSALGSSPSSSDATVNESDVRLQVWGEEVKLLYAHLPVSQAVALVNGGVLALVQSTEIGPARSVSWFGCLVLVTLARLSGGVRYARTAPPLRDLRRWQHYFLSGSFLSGVIWGSAAVVLYPAESAIHEVFLIIMLTGMVAGSVTVLTPVYPAFALFAVCAVVPVTVRYLLAGDPLHYATGATGMIFLLAMLVIGRRIHGTLAQSLRLRFENAELIQALKASNEALERRVGERTAALEEQDRRKDQFLATLAHELRNPLAPLASGVEILKQRIDDPVIIAQVNAVMERQVRHMMHLIDDLIDVNRITRGKVALRRRPVELASVIQHAVESCHPLVGQRTIQIMLPESRVHIDGDPARLAQVFSNLLNNACKFTTARGVISIRAERAAREMIITVKDDGIGIPAEKLQSVFDMFTQVDTPPGRASGGLGLGLFLVKQLVELHGGRVEVHSDGAGRGAEFVVHLPVSEGAPASAQAPKPSAPVPQRVLVVDDNRDAADTLATLLQIDGHETALAYDGREALQKARAFEPQVVLLDIGMPGMDGYETCRALRAEWGSALTIIALTGWGQEADRRRSKEAGFDSHMVKPVTRQALTALMS